jgi:hypothetical protein
MYLYIYSCIYIQLSSYLYKHNDFIGWAATDQIYPCRLDKVRCLERGGISKFKYLPKSGMHFFKFFKFDIVR